MPLKDLRMLDFSVFLPGPFAMLILGDLGADVIKIEPPSGDPARRVLATTYRMVNRNKRSIALDLKNKESQAVVARLARWADVAIEGFRPGVAERLGIDYSTLVAYNPSLIYCSVSGYGQTGPDRHRPGHDLNYLARSGILAFNDHGSGSPRPAGLPIADLAGSTYATIAILAALHARQSTGKGAYLDLGIAEAALSFAAVRHGLDPDGRGHDHRIPSNDLFVTVDGERIALGVVEQHFWERFVAAVGNLAPDLREFRYATTEDRLRHGNALAERLREVIRLRPASEWLRLFEQHDLPAELIVPLDLASRSPQIVARDMVMCKEGERHIPFPIHADGCRGSTLRMTAPELGAHTDEILAELGFDHADIARLRAEGLFG